MVALVVAVMLFDTGCFRLVVSGCLWCLRWCLCLCLCLWIIVLLFWCFVWCLLCCFADLGSVVKLRCCFVGLMFA